MALRFVISERFSISREDVVSILIGAAIVGGGVFATYIFEALINLDFGILAPIVVAAFSVAINILRKWLSESTYATKI